MCPCFDSLRKNRAGPRLVCCAPSIATPQGGGNQVALAITTDERQSMQDGHHAAYRYSINCSLSPTHPFRMPMLQPIRRPRLHRRGLRSHRRHRQCRHVCCTKLLHLPSFASPSLLAFGARAGKEEGAISVRDSVEALEKPMELAKGNAPIAGAFLASRTSMLNFPGFDRAHR